MTKEITFEEVSSFLSGRDPMERIISIECGYDDNEVSIIFVNEKGEKRVKKDAFKPFVWVKQSAAASLFEGKRHTLVSKLNRYGIWVKKLDMGVDEGIANERLKNGFGYIFYARKKMSYKTFMRFFTEGGVPIYTKKKKGEEDRSSKNKDYISVSPVEQYMIQTGKRLFKGYESYDELNRFVFDLETQGLNPKYHRIEQIGMRTNKGFEKVVSVEGSTEEELDKSEINGIDEFLRTIAELKPDTVVGHNSENFDWDFLIQRCEILGYNFSEMSLKYFRHPIFKKKKETVLKLGGEVEYYFPTIMWGFNIIDSLHAARRAQAIDSNM